MENFAYAFGRALAFCCERGNFDVSQFLHRLAWELHHSLSHGVSNLAFFVLREGGAREIGRSLNAPILPVETLLGLIAEEQLPTGVCRVRDHILDSARFVGGAVRTSIFLKIPLPKVGFGGGELVAWEGLSGVASRDVVTEVELVGKELERWLEVYAPVIEMSVRAGSRREEMEDRTRYLLGVVHDVRAPIGIMKLLLNEVPSLSGEQRDIIVSLREEVRYIERIASQCAPSSSDDESKNGTSDVWTVVRRVVRRVRADHSEGAHIEAKDCYERYIANIGEIELERVLTNVVSNAARYARKGHVAIEAEVEGEWIKIVVRDTGPGISRVVAEQVNRGDVSHVGSTSGWGVGLLSCKSLLESKGGQFLVGPGERGGTVVEIKVLLSEVQDRREISLSVAEASPPRGGSVEPGGVYIVDDDAEHSSSLIRVLKSRGVDAAAFGDLKSLLSSGALTSSSVLLCDAHMPGGGVEALLGVSRARGLKPQIAAMSGDTSEELLYKVVALGARGFFEKPVRLEELLDWIDVAKREAAQVLRV